MADTSYNSLGVDEVAAQHANAHCVVRLPCHRASIAAHAGLMTALALGR